jgi:hypothetical protein
MTHLLSTLPENRCRRCDPSCSGFGCPAQVRDRRCRSGQEEGRHVHRLPRHSGLPEQLPEIHKVPKISGQSDKYIVAALVAYKKGDRKHPSMRGIAGSLTEQDMADLAAFYAGHTRA